jgi:ABC-type transport system substrate-binding protein
VFSLWLGAKWENYAEEEALDLVREVPGLVEREDRAANIRAFQRRVAEGAVRLPLAPRPLLNVVSDRLDGYDPTLSGSLWNAHQWTLR